MFIEPTILSLFIAKLRGGRLKNLENTYIEGWYLFIIAALIQGLLSLGKKFDHPLATKILSEYFLYVIVLSYTLMMIAIILNLEKGYMKLLFIGLTLNLIVIAFNEGKMPVSLTGLDGVKKGIVTEMTLPERDMDIKHEAVHKGTKFVYLADIFLISKPYPLPKILSIGDIFLMLGAFAFFQEEMVKIKKENLSQNYR